MTNRELVERRSALISEGKFDQLGEVLHDDVLVHFSGAGEATIEGLPALIATLNSFDALELQVENEHMIDEGDRIAVRYTVSGKQVKSFMGLEPGAEFEYYATAIHHVADGKIVETWNIEDFMTLFRQLGAIPAPAH